MLTMRSYINIDLKKIKINIEEIKKITNKKIIAVIKSNAYGFGLIEIAKYLEKEKINYFAVATLDEAIKLRKKNIRSNIIVLEKSKEYQTYLKYNLIYALYDIESLKEIILSKLPLRIHIKYNSGLNRLGIDDNNIDILVDTLKSNKIKIEGIFTHIADTSTYKNQLDKFEFFAKKLNFIKNLMIHIDSSRTIGNKNFSNAIRIGLSLFTFKENALQLFAPIIKIKEVNKGEPIGYHKQELTPSKGFVLTIPLGYADGWNSLRRTIGYIDNSKIQQIGETCMDHMMLFSNKQIKSPTIEIIGDHITLDYLSIIYEESKYELLSTLSSRLKRSYFK